jgi:hypothetical protein
MFTYHLLLVLPLNKHIYIAKNPMNRLNPFGLVVITAGLFFTSELSLALEKDQQPAGPDLPVKTIVMYSSGVGFYEHAGKVDGNAKVEMKFNVDDVNDLLKSMVLRDLGGGKISTVSFGSKDPITRTLRTFAIDLTHNPTLGSLLSQIRGEKVTIEAPTKVQGIILGVETRQEKAGDDLISKEVLNLLTETGLRSVSLDVVGSIKLDDEKLDAELRKALMILATSHRSDKKSVTLNFLGDGERQVRVGYIQESPVWKTSYRLVLDDEDKPMLQGWAIVENQTEDDWQNVDLTLVSGRPISFVMDLYQPLYVNRPVVEPELYASVEPRIYEQDLSGATDDFKRAGNGFAEAEAKTKSNSNRYYAEQLLDRAKQSDGKKDGLLRALSDSESDENWSLASVESAGQGGDVGELFRYQIATPVSLARGRSAMLPIVNESVEGEKVSIYNTSVHLKHPLNGLRLKNTTDLHLMQGPVTVFDGGIYAGDSRIADLQPKTERLMTYAMDLDVEVATTSPNIPEALVDVKISSGTLVARTRHMRQTDYIVKNSSREAKNVLIERGFDADWTLLVPKEPAEKTRDVLRFALKAAPGKPASLTVKEEHVVRSTVTIKNLNGGNIQFYLSSKVVSDEVKDALKEITRRKSEINKIAAEKQEAIRQIAAIEAEQNRIRQNMAKLERDSDLYRRYVTKFTEQEDGIELLRKEVESAIAKQSELQQSLNKYLSELEID